MKLTSKSDRLKTKGSLTQRDTIREKSLPSNANQTIVSAKSKSQKTIVKIPQNFNSFRHVITNSTTGDDIDWIVHLREMKMPVGMPQ